MTPIALVWLIGPKGPLHRVERAVTLAFVGLAGSGALAILVALVRDMLRRPGTMDGLQLLTSSIAVWATNVLTFSLLYWQMDRGGPSLRASGALQRDWMFAQDQITPRQPFEAWRPAFIDYLFLAYSTATAFSTTDSVPLSGRAKLVMMVESSISLVCLVVVGARAINVLGN
ncbi:MAG: hypothetical protein ACJ798_12865 [Phenylobacterium sp.]